MDYWMDLGKKIQHMMSVFSVSQDACLAEPCGIEESSTS